MFYATNGNIYTEDDFNTLKSLPNGTEFQFLNLLNGSVKRLPLNVVVLGDLIFNSDLKAESVRCGRAICWQSPKTSTLCKMNLSAFQTTRIKLVIRQGITLIQGMNAELCYISVAKVQANRTINLFNSTFGELKIRYAPERAFIEGPSSVTLALQKSVVGDRLIFDLSDDPSHVPDISLSVNGSQIKDLNVKLTHSSHITVPTLSLFGNLSLSLFGIFPLKGRRINIELPEHGIVYGNVYSDYALTIPAGLCCLGAIEVPQ